jgi:hypothetical protein
MTSPSSNEDEILFARIREATAGTGAIQDAIRRVAKAAFATRLPHADRLLARLTYDSLLEPAGSVRDAGSDDRRVVTFDAPTLSVEIEISGDRLLGQIVPPTPAEIELMSPDGPLDGTSADALGCFTLPAPSPGAVRFGCHTQQGLVLTDWVRL